MNAERLRKRWRAWLRAAHRDLGYLAVGLTCIYALSGLAINHIEDVDPNFKEVTEVYQLDNLPSGKAAALAKVLAALEIEAVPTDSLLESGTLEVFFPRREIKADLATGRVVDTAEKPRFFFRVANWLHYNRGKRAWTFIADGYAVFLLFLALSGPFMLKGKKGLWGRGGILIGLGVLLPVLYVTLSGGP